MIWESGEWIPSTWYVAEETRVFDVANLAVLFYGITTNMQLSVALACCTITLGIVISGYYFVSALNLERVQKGIFILLCLVLPNSFSMLELFYFFASYYSPHIILLFITLAVYTRVLEHQGKNRNLIITLILHFMLGTQGVRAILVIAGPVFAVEIVRSVYIFYKKMKYGFEDVKLFVWSFLLIVVGFVGGLLPFSMGEELSRNIRNAPSKFLMYVLPDIAKALGYKDVDNVVEVIGISFFVILAVIVFVFIVYGAIQRKDLEPREWTYLVLFGSPIATAVIVTFTTVESSGRYYFVFLIAMALATALLYNSLGKYQIQSSEKEQI